jgi:FAD/FMN-containing dehydrogenase
MKRRTFLRSTAAAAALSSLHHRPLLAGSFSPVAQRARDVEAVTGDGRRVTLTTASIDELAARLRGRVLLADTEGYDDARRIRNASFDKRPALIAQVTGVADVRTAVDFARDNGGLLLAVKCGGHSVSGQSTCDMGMMIDLSPFRDVRVDPAARTARVTGGSLLGALDHEAMAYDLVTTMGTVSHTGVGGLVTGGGFGRLGRRFGLAIDNLLSVDVVTADGQFRRASADDNADLFWGVRGGGGNFGIVTSFEFRLHPMQRQVIAGPIMFPIARLRDVLSVYAEYGPVAPDELQLDVGIRNPPPGQPGMAGFLVCWSGDPAGLDRALAPVRRLGTPASDNVSPTDYVALQRSGDSDDFRAVGSYTKSGFISELSPALISAIVDNFGGHPAQMFFQHCGGAINRVPASATALSQRDALANMLCMVGWPTGSDPSEPIAWIRDYWTNLERFTHGFYVNDLEPDMTAATIRDNYRQNHDRLVQVKNRYDPNNLFRLNANVRPTA